MLAVLAVLGLLGAGAYAADRELRTAGPPATSPTAAPSGGGPTATASSDPTGEPDTTGPHFRPGPFGDPPRTSPAPGALAASPCGPFPSFPDASCTGWEHTGVTLRDCPSAVVEPGAELDGCRFADGLYIQAPNVTITRSLIEGIVEPHDDLQNLMLIDVEIDGSGYQDPNSAAAIGNINYTCIRCDIHDTGRGANLDDNVHIEASYLHDFPNMGENHLTAIGSNGGSNFTIVHNNLECAVYGCSAALSLYGDFAPIDDVLIQHNLLNTYGSYCTYAGSVEGKAYPVGTNIRYLDNRFGKKFRPDCGAYGPVASWLDGDGNVWRGNEWADGSGPVKPAR